MKINTLFVTALTTSLLAVVPAISVADCSTHKTQQAGNETSVGGSKIAGGEGTGIGGKVLVSEKNPVSGTQLVGNQTRLSGTKLDN